MALYGVDFYGASRYGPRVFLDFDASPMRAVSRDYGKIHVSWSSPGGNWSILRVVRNAYGVPVSQVDGQILVNTNSGPAATGTIDPPANNTIDTDLVGGRFYYYAVWLYVPSIDEWTRAAYTTGLAVADYGYSDRLWTLTPSIHRTTSGALLDQDNETLKTYLKIPGFQLDHIRAEYETLRYVNDPHRVAGGLLPVMAHQYGQFFEPELGMAQMRKLLASTVYLYRNKGTVPGVEGFVKAVSGFGAKVLPLKNLMLDYNDSSAEESIGNWYTQAGDNCTLARYVADDLVAAAGEFYEGQRQAGLFKQVTTTAGATKVRLATNPIALTQGIPVTAGASYVVSGYFRADTVARVVGIDVYWYDASGLPLGPTLNANVGSNTVGAWTRLSAVHLAPAGAVYAGIRITHNGTALNEVHYFDALQFEQGSTATAFEDARLIDIQVYAPRVNQISNPNFETDTTFWSAGGVAGAVARVTTQAHSGTASMQVTWPTTPAQTSSAYTTVNTDPGTTYMASVWVLQTTGPRVYLRAGGESSAPSVTGPAWQRLSVPFTTGGTQVNFEIVLLDAATAGQTVYIDDALMEKGAGLFDYFDGTTYAFTAESMWEGTPNASRSHYYPQRKTKNYRMNALLADYTPMGSSYRLRYALTV